MLPKSALRGAQNAAHLEIYISSYINTKNRNITSLQMIPTMTFHPDHFSACIETVFRHSFWHIFFLTVFLAYLLTFFLAYPLTFFLAYLLTFILTFFFDLFSGILSGISSDFRSGISFDIHSCILSGICSAYLLIFFVAFYLAYPLTGG